MIDITKLIKGEKPATEKAGEGAIRLASHYALLESIVAAQGISTDDEAFKANPMQNFNEGALAIGYALGRCWASHQDAHECSDHLSNLAALASPKGFATFRSFVPYLENIGERHVGGLVKRITDLQQVEAAARRAASKQNEAKPATDNKPEGEDQAAA
ncbi:MAG: hypothetical protein Q8K65_06185 [Alphaproteobacteria bacterium]|nr:hypothetical protein [Alphaproteobacteria bacterium]